MAIDLGSFLGSVGQIATAYNTYRGSRQTQNVATWPGPATGQPQTAGMDLLPFVDCIPEPPSCNGDNHYWSPRANRGQGGWVKYRRRRKQLATKSDLKDLAALKSIMSPGDLKTWIATHS